MSRPVPVSDTEGCEPQSHELASLEHDTSSQQSPVQFPETIQTATTDARVRNESRVPSPQSEGASTLVASEPSSQNGHCSPPSATPGNPPRSNISVVQFVRSRWPNAANTQTMLAWSVVVLTIVTVVYSWRANLMQNWNNEAALYEYCHEVHYRDTICTSIQGEQLNAPPFSRLETAYRRLRRGVESQIKSFHESTADHRYVIMLGLFALGILSALAAVYIYGRVHSRRAESTRISDHSMARRHFSLPSVAMTVASSTEIHQQNDIPRRQDSMYHAFAPADKVIKQLKAMNDRESTVDSLHYHRSSNPWDRHRAKLTDANTSLLLHAELYHYDPDKEINKQWTKVKHLSRSKNSQHSSTSSLRQRVTSGKEPPTPPPTPPTRENSGVDDKESGHSHRLRRWMSPKPITIHEHPPPELHDGDAKAALALIGAIGAAYTGGKAMAKCPVDVTPDKGLPDSWMHTAPQDIMHS